jgi:hypothetical protein
MEFPALLIVGHLQSMEEWRVDQGSDVVFRLGKFASQTAE